MAEYGRKEHYGGVYGAGRALPRLGTSWYEIPGSQKGQMVERARQTAAGLPESPEERKRLIEPLLTMLTVMGSGLNIPSAMISGAAEQLLDHTPGFSARDYFRRVFDMKGGQVSWRDVLGVLAEKNPNQNVFDSKWFLIVGGLTLDIVLDPLNYIGIGFIPGMLDASDATQLAFKTFHEVQKGLVKASKTAVTKGFRGVGPETAAVFAKTFKEVMGTRIGLKFPLSKNLIKPFRGVSKEVMSQIQFRNLPVRQGFVELMQRPTIVSTLREGVEKLPGMKKLISFGEDLFVPFARVQKEVGEALLQRDEVVLVGANQVNAALEQLVRGTPLEKSQRLRELGSEFLENYKGIAYTNSDLLKAYTHKAQLFNKLVKEAGSMEDFTVKGFMKELGNLGDEYKKIVTKDIRKVLQNQEKLLAAWKLNPGDFNNIKPEFPVKDLVKATEEIWTGTTLRQLQSTMHKLGWEYDESILHLLAESRAQTELLNTKIIFSESTPEARKLLSEMSTDQVDSINRAMDRARLMYDKMFDTELAAGIGVDYYKDYMTRYVGPSKGKGPTLAVGPEKQFFQWARKAKSSKELAQRIASQMVASGFVPMQGTGKKAKKEAIKEAMKLLRSGDKATAERFGQVLTTITEGLYVRGVAHTKVMSRKIMMDDIAKYGVEWGKKKAILTGMKRAEGVPELAKYVFDEETADAISRTVSTLASDKGIAQFMAMTDGVLNWWKVMATSVNPGFHFRNFYSNHFLGWIWQGPSYFNPRNHRLAQRMTFKATRGKEELALKKALGTLWTDPVMNRQFAHGWTELDMFDWAFDHGVIKRQMRRTGIIAEPAVRKEARTFLQKVQSWNPLSTKGPAARAGEWLGSNVENEARIAAWLNEFKRIGDPKIAWQNVQDVFVHYTKVTPFEREYAKRIVPFYTWMKQNTINMLKFVYLQPGRMSKIPKFANAIQGDRADRVPAELIPEYMQELWMWQTPLVLPNGDPLFFNPNFPFQDLAKFPIGVNAPRRFMRQAMTSISPLFKLAFEMMGPEGYDIFRQQALVKYPGYRAPAPGVLSPILKTMTLISPEICEKFGIVFDGERVTMHPKLARAFETLLPQIKNYGTMLWQDPTTETADKIFKFVSYTVGVKLKPMNVRRQQYYHYLDIIKERKRYERAHAENL